ncbi:pyridoxal phosphate-dependent decarboxylase family protein [Actinomadura parmotrematis]|uniref:Aminotransferase class V-fold PLP-dependent enzyme n=1 Tax=Actinomadura parmotrematis TaxID=2864039 RepID=A0ABS7FU85_9ACTN|nr:aminotransferase class V-fold PLP-dependent enzyme [Actinomadura parmotrematis]MBW8483973.1 aminotransferase class V-fold PLP-dependent enzyme [Actinomadura parmotrematis]
MLPENGLPEHGRPVPDLLAELARLRADDLPVRGGKVTAYVYDTGRAEIHDGAARAFGEMLEVNCLDPTAFPSIVALERQIVTAVAARLGGGPHTPGIFTSGGTESIMLAVKAARDTTGRTAIVAPITAHPAFHKAAHYLGMTVVQVPVDAGFRADVDAVAAAITDDTALVVASAPSYPQGVLDPVADIAALAAARGVLCHVDACVGGWVLPWLPDVPPFDLSVPGVTSLSCDLHKYGYAPKGASVVLYGREDLRRAAYFASAEWPGYTVINSGVQSSKSAGPLGAAWTTLMALGDTGYRALATEAKAAADALVAGVAGIPGLAVLGAPAAPLVAIASTDPALDVFVLADKARERGWFFQPQLAYQGIPANLHFTVTSVSSVPGILEALAASAEDAVAAGPPDVPAGLVESLDLDALTDADFAGLLGAVGGEGGGMATVNAILDGLPPATREALLIRFLSALYSG